MTRTARNKALVVEAMTSLFQRRDPLAVERLYRRDYIQHNPAIPQGRDALAKLVAQLPEAVYYEPGLIVAEGDYVAIHGRIRGWAPRTQVVVDIFRVQDGQLAEHWDVLQDEVPPDGGRAGLSMFSTDEAGRQHDVAAPSAAEHEDYDGLLRANLTRVFGERRRAERRLAIAELYDPDAELYEPDGVATGHAAIDDAVEALLAHLPPEFVFSAAGPGIGHHGLGRLRWIAGPLNGPAVATGTDVAHVAGGRIHSLHVLLDPGGA
jgi:predicted SnoaL-like aldol condensation-catalyzing enzyme